MTENEALDALIAEIGWPAQVKGTVAYLRDHQDVAAALGIGAQRNAVLAVLDRWGNIAEDSRLVRMLTNEIRRDLGVEQ